jgi:hypothetical protein
MNETKTITINVELNEWQALVFAQFLKRVGFNDYRSNAADDDEAYTMIDAGEKIRDALAEQGFAPR